MSSKLAFSNLACPRWSLDQTIAAARRYGYDGIELRLLRGEPIDPARDDPEVRDAVRRIRDAGVAVCAFDTSCRFNLSDAGSRAVQIEEARRWIALAHDLQVRVLRVFGGADEEGADQDAANGWVASALSALVPAAGAAGVVVALETHDAFSSARRVKAVLDQVPAPSIGVLWDSHHPFRMGELPSEVIGMLGSRLVHAHVKDARLIPETGEWQLLPMGEGEVPVKAVLDELQRARYDGWISVEWEKRWHPELAEPEIALPQHSAWLRKILQSVEFPGGKFD